MNFKRSIEAESVKMTEALYGSHKLAKERFVLKLVLAFTSHQTITGEKKLCQKNTSYLTQRLAIKSNEEILINSSQSFYQK
jgi:hypothetical protein